MGIRKKIADLVVSIRGENKDLEAKLKESERSSSRFSKTVGNTLGGAFDSLGGKIQTATAGFTRFVGAITATIGAVTGLVGLVGGLIFAITSLARQSKKAADETSGLAGSLDDLKRSATETAEDIRGSFVDAFAGLASGRAVASSFVGITDQFDALKDANAKAVDEINAKFDELQTSIELKDLGGVEALVEIQNIEHQRDANLKTQAETFRTLIGLNEKQIAQQKERVLLENQLAVARAEGNTEEVRSIEDSLSGLARKARDAALGGFFPELLDGLQKLDARTDAARDSRRQKEDKATADAAAKKLAAELESIQKIEDARLASIQRMEDKESRHIDRIYGSFTATLGTLGSLASIRPGISEIEL